MSTDEQPRSPDASRPKPKVVMLQPRRMRRAAAKALNRPFEPIVGYIGHRGFRGHALYNPTTHISEVPKRLLIIE